MSLLSPLPNPLYRCRWPPPHLAPQEFSFSQVWANNQRPLQCAFSLERYSHSPAHLSCKISVRQVKGDEHLLQIYTSVVEVSGQWREHRRRCLLCGHFFSLLMASFITLNNSCFHLKACLMSLSGSLSHISQSSCPCLSHFKPVWDCMRLSLSTCLFFLPFLN